MFDIAECDLTSFACILGRIGRLYPCTLSNVIFRLAQHMNCEGYPSTERLMGSIYDLLCCIVLLCFAALKTWVIYSWTFALGTGVFFLYCQLRLFSFLLVGACYFVLCLAPFYVCIGFFGGFLPSTGLGLLRCAVQLLLFWLVLLLLTEMGFPGAVIFAAPSLVPTPVCTVSLVDVATTNSGRK